MKKTIFLIIILLFYLIIIGRTLLSNYNKMFDFHDGTIPLRIAEFAYNLTHFKIPPRMAPHFSFNLTYPVFNFYAPFAFWTGSLIYLTGIGIVPTLKILFLLPLIIAFIGMFLFINVLFGFVPALVGSVLYATSPWLAVELFIRGNIGELFVIAFLPLSLYLLIRTSQIGWKKIYFIMTVIVLHFLFTSHNIFSVFSLIITVLISLLTKNKLRNITIIIFALLLSSYFYVPLLIETPLVSTSQAIRNTHYWDHFLCLWQLWTTNHWGYGGSIITCELDAMPFMLGKWQILAGLIGLVSFIFMLIQIVLRKKIQVNQKILMALKIILFFIMIGFLSTYLTLEISKPIWKIFEPVLALVQFPWRFNLFITFVLALLGSFTWYLFNNRIVNVLAIIFSIFLIINNSKFFQKYEHNRKTYLQKYFSEYVLFEDVVFSIHDYFPTVGDFNYWLSYRTEWDITKKPMYVIGKKPFISFERTKNINVLKNSTYYRKALSEAKDILVNIHYYPYWIIKINGKNYVPTKFDVFARPIIRQETTPFTIEIIYHQTLAQKLGNTITAFTSLGLFLWLVGLHNRFLSIQNFFRSFIKRHFLD